MQNKPENVSENVSENISENVSENVSENIYENISEGSNIDASDEIIEKVSFFEKLKEKIPSVGQGNYRKAVVAFAIFSILFSLFRIYVIKKSIEFPGFAAGNPTYKLENTFYTSLFNAIYVATGVVCLFVGIFSHKVEYGPNKRSNVFVFVSSLAGFCMVGCAGFFIYRSALDDSAMMKWEYWTIILMLFTGIYFAMDAVGFVGEKTRPWFSLITVVFCVVRIICEFILTHEDQYLSSTEFHLLGLVFILLFFVNGARLQVYEKVGMWYKVFGLFASLALLVYSVPEIYISLFEPYRVDSNFIFCIVDVCLAFYCLSRLMSVKYEKSAAYETE